MYTTRFKVKCANQRNFISRIFSNIFLYFFRSDTLKNFPNYKKSVFQSNAQNNSVKIDKSSGKQKDFIIIHFSFQIKVEANHFPEK